VYSIILKLTVHSSKPETVETTFRPMSLSCLVQKFGREASNYICTVLKKWFTYNSITLYFCYRPRFLQYKYLYDYRHNYYDDVIDYLDKRQKGLRREIPHPQTWAERTLRTYSSQINRMESFRRLVEDTKLVTETKISGAFQLHHSKSYINRRYSSILA
jgi:hypothetical protein